MKLSKLRDAIAKVVSGVEIRVFKKKHFLEKRKSGTHQALALGLAWKDPKGFLISTKFRGGASSHFRFEHFYIVDLHSVLPQPGHERAERENLLCKNAQNGNS